jgi:hypothetical protein
MSCTKIADEIGLQLSNPALQCKMRNLLLLLKLTASLALQNSNDIFWTSGHKNMKNFNIKYMRK